MAKFKTNDIINNFVVTRKKFLKDEKAYLYELDNHITGATVMWLDTQEENKLFSIAFKTIPEDDTGVFHILEHSLLNGSEKFPIKEPFVEFLKSSMNTYLNALTYMDKTVFPVSSKNEQDFFNLMELYLNSVFHPLIYKNPNIFYQEGWHFEMWDENQEPTVNGVVLNEMKGDDSSRNTIIANEIARLLYPDNYQRFVSGGDPREIPKLSYEKFLEYHKRFYTPDNALFFVEGAVDIEKVLGLINEETNGFTSKKNRTADNPRIFRMDMKKQEPKAGLERIAYYGIEDDSPQGENEDYVVFGRIMGDFNDKNRIVAMNILGGYLGATNDSPLSKRLLDKNLALSVNVGVDGNQQQPALLIKINQCDSSKINIIKKEIIETIDEIIDKGLDEKKLNALINQYEFRFLDKCEPKALMVLNNLLDSALYEGAPELYLEYSDTFAYMRELIKNGGYEKILKEMFDFSRFNTLKVLPTADYEKKLNQKEKEVVKELTKDLTLENRREIVRLNKELEAWQSKPNDEETLKCIPKLDVKKIPRDLEKIPTITFDIDKTKVRWYKLNNNHIIHMTMYFPVQVKDFKDLSYLSFLPSLIGELPTKNYDVTTLQREIKTYLGTFFVDVVNIGHYGETDVTTVCYMCRFSCLKKNLKMAIKLVKEILFNTQYSDLDKISVIYTQLEKDFKADIYTSGHKYAKKRATASYSAENAADECIDGIEAYSTLLEILDDEKNMLPMLKEKYEDYIVNNVNSDKMLLSVIADEFNTKEELVNSLELEQIIKDMKPQKNQTKDLVDFRKLAENKLTENPFKEYEGQQNEIDIPGTVSYVAVAGNLFQVGQKYTGKFLVLENILTLEYLWNEVRVKNGAYDGGAIFTNDGNIAFYSYRDPNPEETINVIKEIPKFFDKMRECPQEIIDDYIISSLALLDPLQDAKDIADRCDYDYLKYITEEYRINQRHEVLDLTVDKINQCRDIIEELLKNPTIFVLGPNIKEK
ncbi:hypothetical protein SAMN04487761_1244 [Lachnospiraceae bacterium C7]|nr:hypothetical protein SAMN04487761_1244 [Lachnospiraceae bacterium C7]